MGMRKAEIKLVCMLLFPVCLCGCGTREVTHGWPMEITDVLAAFIPQDV